VWAKALLIVQLPHPLVGDLCIKVLIRKGIQHRFPFVFALVTQLPTRETKGDTSFASKPHTIPSACTRDNSHRERLHPQRISGLLLSLRQSVIRPEQARGCARAEFRASMSTKALSRARLCMREHSCRGCRRRGGGVRQSDRSVAAGSTQRGRRPSRQRQRTGQTQRFRRQR
jgi:hypothetical protein